MGKQCCGWLFALKAAFLFLLRAHGGWMCHLSVAARQFNPKQQLERAIIIPAFSFYGSGIQRAERGRLPELRDGSQMLAWVLLLSCDWQVVAAVTWGVQQSLWTGSASLRSHQQLGFLTAWCLHPDCTHPLRELADQSEAFPHRTWSPSHPIILFFLFEMSH